MKWKKYKDEWEEMKGEDINGNDKRQEWKKLRMKE